MSGFSDNKRKLKNQIALLDFRQFFKMRIKNRKEPTALEKSTIEQQVAEAYQTILNNCKDGGSISQALNLLGKRITTMQISINEISKVAINIVNEVHSIDPNVKNGEGNPVVEAVVAGQLLNESLKTPKNNRNYAKNI